MESECGKIRTRKTPNTVTSPAVNNTDGIQALYFEELKHPDYKFELSKSSRTTSYYLITWNFNIQREVNET